MWHSPTSLLLSSNLMHTVAFSTSEMHVTKVSCWPKAASQRGTSEKWEEDSTGCLFETLQRKKLETLQTICKVWIRERKKGGRKKHLRRKKEKKHNIQGTLLISFSFSVNSLIHWNKDGHPETSDICTVPILLTFWVFQHSIYYWPYDLHFLIVLLQIWSNMMY